MGFILKRVILSSLTYSCMGHSKSYINSLVEKLPADFNYLLYKYGNEGVSDVKVASCDGDYSFLDYNSKQKFASYRKIFRRFFVSFYFYNRLRKIAKNNDFIYFMDYEYISLLLFLFFFRKNEKAVWIHSATLGTGFYNFYKRIFFYFVSFISTKKVKFVVNGVVTEKELANLLPRHNITTIQYPSDLSQTPISKRIAKNKLGLEHKIVFSSIGMLRRDKNYEQLFENFSKSKYANDNNAVLLIAGALSNLTEEFFEELKVRFELQNVQTIYKYFSAEEINELFSATDYMLMTYGHKGSSQSGPLSLCRHYFIPCIVYNGGEIGYYVNECSVGYAVNSSNEFVDCINRIASDDFNDSLEHANECYSWDNVVKQYINLFSI